MFATISDDVKNTITEIYRRGNNPDRLFMFEHIPSNRLNNAIKSYASIIGSDETVIFLFDDTIFGSAKDGFMLTTKRLYYKNMAEAGDSVDISDILNMTLKRSMLSPAIIVNTDLGDLVISIIKASDQNVLFSIIDQTVRFLKNLADSVASASQAPAGQPLVCRGCGANYARSIAICEYCGSSL